MVRERKFNKRSDGSRGIATLAMAFAFAFAAATVLPLSTDTGFGVNGALAAGNSGGKGKALGKAGAPGQQQDQIADADEHAVPSSGAVSEMAADSPGGKTLLVAEDSSKRVIQELAGLPENSTLSEEEELEAIRNGWGNWRTADGPGSATAQ